MLLERLVDLISKNEKENHSHLPLDEFANTKLMDTSMEIHKNKKFVFSETQAIMHV